MLETSSSQSKANVPNEPVVARAPLTKKEVPAERPPRNLRNKIIFAFVGLGVIAALASAYVYARPKHPLPPAFNPAADPFAKGVYANGIIESDQSNGENINLYPEVPGTVVQILVNEGQHVTKGTPLFVLDDSVQRGIVEQQRSQLAASRALLDELKAQPRRETLEVVRAQMEMASASLKTAEDSLAKQRRSYELDPKSVSKDVFDNAVNAEKVARANVDVATRQYQLTKAGAWVYDIRNQSQQVEALGMAVASSTALLGKYTVKAPSDGVVMSILTSVGSYLSPQGAYDSYTQSYAPAMVMGSAAARLHVRCYVDEILIQRLPTADRIQAKMLIRGTDVSVPLEFVRVQPYVSPKIQLSNERTERVDLRVLPIIFRFTPPKGVALYPGEMVDVYVASN